MGQSIVVRLNGPFISIGSTEVYKELPLFGLALARNYQLSSVRLLVFFALIESEWAMSEGIGDLFDGVALWLTSNAPGTSQGASSDQP